MAEMLLNGFTITAQGSVQLWFASGLARGRFNKFCAACYCLLLAVINQGIQFLGWDAFFMEPLMLYFASRFLYCKSRAVCAAVAVLWVCVSELSFGVVDTVEALVFPYTAGKNLLYILVAVAAVTAPFLSAVCCAAIIRWFPVDDNSVRVLLPPCAFFGVVEKYLLIRFYGGTATPPETGASKTQFALLVLQLLGFAALACTLYSYKRACESIRIQNELALLRRETHMHLSYVEEAKRRYELTRAFRHDVRNHLTVLDGLLNAGETERASDYLKTLETVSEGLSFPVSTNNPVIDILLGEKLGSIRAVGTETDISVTLPCPCGVEDMELCVIFANALDNASHALDSVCGTKAFRISTKRQGDFLLLEFDNTCASGTYTGMGTGLSNIKAVAERHGGTVSVAEDSGHFRLSVLLDVSLPPSGIS